MSGFELVGATDAVEALSRAIRKIGSTDFRRQLLDEMSAAALDMVREEFFVSRDPYGTPWKPLKHARRGTIGAGPLLKTGRMEGRIRRKVVGDGFTLISPATQTDFHQKGTRHIPARPIFPDRNDLPAEWLAAFERIADNAVRHAIESSL